MGEQNEKRYRKGQFQPGNVPKSPGRPMMPPELRKMCQEVSKEAIEIAVEVMRNGESDKTKLMAVNTILDRAYGKPPQAITGDNENPVAIQLIEIVKSHG